MTDKSDKALNEIAEIALPQATIRALLADYLDLLKKYSEESAESFRHGLDEEEGFTLRAERIVESTIISTMMALTLKDEAQDVFEKVLAKMEPAKDDPRLASLRAEIANRASSMNKGLAEWTLLERETTNRRVAQIVER